MRDQRQRAATPAEAFQDRPDGDRDYRAVRTRDPERAVAPVQGSSPFDIIGFIQDATVMPQATSSPAARSRSTAPGSSSRATPSSRCLPPR